MSKTNYSITPIMASSPLYPLAQKMCGFIIGMDGAPQIARRSGGVGMGDVIHINSLKLITINKVIKTQII
jgi:hypothetical protein